MKSFSIKNKHNMCLEILDWGCRIISLRVPTKNGELIDTVLKYNEIKDYANDKNYLGCTVGRYANRIENGKFNLLDTDFQLSRNEQGKNHLHGGFNGFDKKFWDLVEISENKLEMEIISKCGEEGYPGNLTVRVSFELADNNKLTVSYQAKSDAATIVNITNHSYFNLADDKNSIDSHHIQVNADYYTPLSDTHLPTYPFKKSVQNTVFDLRTFKSVIPLKDNIGNANYCMNIMEETISSASIIDSKSGRKLTIYSDYPGMQIYFGNYLTGQFRPYQGICCEPHYYPNSPNVESYPPVILHPEEKYEHRISYHFENF